VSADRQRSRPSIGLVAGDRLEEPPQRPRPRQKAPPPPRHLSAAAKKWWRSVVADFELEEHHLRLLQLACEAWDRADQARRILAREGVTYLDRFNRPKKHPAIAIEEGARAAFAKLIVALDLEGSANPYYRRRVRAAPET